MLGWIVEAQHRNGNETDQYIRIGFWHVIAMMAVN